MRKILLIFLLLISFSTMSCSLGQTKIDVSVKEKEETVVKIENKIQTTQVIDLIKELKEIKSTPPADLKKLDFQIIPDQEMLYIPTNLGILVTYNLEQKETKIIQNQETAKDLPILDYRMFSFNNNLVSDAGADRYSISATLFDKKTFKKITTTYTHHFIDPLLVNQDRIYRRGTFYNVGDYGIEVFDKDLKHLWLYPDFRNGPKNFFPLENSFELDGNFHLFCGSDSNNPYLTHVVIQAVTGKILLNERLIEDIDEIWWNSSWTPGEVGKRVIQEDKNVFFEGQDKKGVYVTKFTFQENLILALQWKQYFTSSLVTDKLIPGVSNDIGLTNLIHNNLNLILFPIWTQSADQNVYSFDLYCIDKMDGNIKWIKKSITTAGDLNIFSTNDGIVMETSSKSVNNSFSHFLNSINLNNGKVIWTRALNDKYFTDEIMNSSSICTKTTYFQFNQETMTLQKINLSDGQMVEKTFSQSKPLFGSFYKANDQPFLLLTNKNPRNQAKITKAFLYEVE